ncbi:MAG TPA: hypothetical protein VMC80_03375 [Patescibacteria group bacterium]|nr:hypothetical protein [Patescibacteria group bacterium]
MLMLETDIKGILINAERDGPKSPELVARELEQSLRKQPFEVRKYLQAYLDVAPLTKDLPKSDFEVSVQNLNGEYD